MALTALFAVAPIVLAGCDGAKGPAKRQVEGARSSIDTSYRGPVDETLSVEQQRRLRERGNMQR